MAQVQIRHIRRFQKMQRRQHSCSSINGISIRLKGFKSYEQRGYPQPSSPAISLLKPGIPLSFVADHQRENVVIFMDSTPWQLSTDGLHAQLDIGKSISVPSTVPIEKAQVPALRRLLLNMQRLSRSSIASDQVMLHCQLFTVLEFHVKAAARLAHGHCHSAVLRLRQLIDADETYSSSISDLAQQIEMSMDHLCRLFDQHFGVTPQNYRNRCRLERVYDLFGNDELTIGEIGTLVGFEYPSGLSNFTRKHLGCSPSELRRDLRMNG